MEADSDSEAEFEGFEADDLIEVNNVNDLPNFEIPELDVDDDFRSDLNNGWRKEATDPVVVPFTGDFGINEYVDNDVLTPYVFFKLFMNDDVFESISSETNRYKHQNFRDENMKPHARMRSWYDTTLGEIKQWLGLEILTGLVEKSDLDKYWSTDNLIATSVFNDTMPRDRFMNILTCFHLNNNENMPHRCEDRYDPLYKVGPLYDVARERCMNVYTPDEGNGSMERKVSI